VHGWDGTDQPCALGIPSARVVIVGAVRTPGERLLARLSLVVSDADHGGLSEAHATAIDASAAVRWEE